MNPHVFISVFVAFTLGCGKSGLDCEATCEELAGKAVDCGLEVADSSTSTCAAECNAAYEEAKTAGCGGEFEAFRECISDQPMDCETGQIDETSCAAEIVEAEECFGGGSGGGESSGDTGGW